MALGYLIFSWLLLLSIFGSTRMPPLSAKAIISPKALLLFSCFVAYLVAYFSAEKWSMSGTKSTLARCDAACAATRPASRS